MNVVLITHDSIYGRYFAASVAAACQIDRVIVETTHAPAAFYVKKFRRVGPVNFVFQYWLNRWFKSEGARALPRLEFPPHEKIPSVNALTFGPDDLVLGFGTSYITARTLATAGHGFLNLHTGALPEYRGVKSEFWALRNRDFTRLGWTLHYMTPKLDAGDIVLSGTVPYECDNPATVRAKLLRDAVPAIAQYVTQRRDASFTLPMPQKQQGGTYYSTPTLRDWTAARSAWESTES